MTAQQQANAEKFLRIASKVTLAAAAMAGGPTGMAIGVAVEIAAPLLEAAGILGRAEEPSDEVMQRAFAACQASNIGMNDDVDARLRELRA